MLKPAKVGNLFFTHEVTSPAITGLLRRPFGIRHHGSAGRGGIKGNDCHVGGPAFGGRSLHAAETE